jgi:hypothetical protein
MSNMDIKGQLDPLLKQLAAEKSLDVAEKLAATLVGFLGVSAGDRYLLNIPRVDAELSRFELAPGFARQAAAYELPNDQEEIFDLKLFWIKKATKTNLSWLVGLTPNYEDSEANDYKNIGIDFVVPETSDSLIILLSSKYKIRSLELKGHVTQTQAEIFSNWMSVSSSNIESSKESKQFVHSKLWESFNFEPINRKFYQELVERFSLLVLHLEKEFGRKPSVMFTTRLIGRLLFVWFLKKKNLINTNINYFQVADPYDQTGYYKDYLEILFFEVLNQEISERNNNDTTTPYLNGGLFDVSSTDFHNDPKLSFPNGYFNQLFDTLNKYNFTVDESSPEFQHVAIDPEMLGRIFESLLAEQVDDITGASKKKATGAFYTPREIVSYMCEESIIEYLKGRIPQSADSERRIEELVRLPETIFRDQDQNKRRDWKPYNQLILNALDGEGNDPLTILDPAVGSGAFPMGMLHLLVKIYSRLDAKYEKNISNLKRAILSKTLYGVDIEQTAIEICRLRAWLSIIVDIDRSDNIQPLPNLDFKFACANTLIPLDNQRQATLLSDHQLKDKLLAIRNQYFLASSKIKKNALQSEYEKLTHQEDFFDNKREKQLKSYKPFDVGASSDFYDCELHHGINEFDIVIGNPPYVQLQKFSKQKIQKDLEEVEYETFTKTGDLYCLFYEKGISLLKQGGILSFITSNKWMRAGYGEKTRGFFLKHNPILLADLGPNIFESATVDTNIIFIKKEKNKDNLYGVTVTDEWKHNGDFSKFINEHKSHIMNLSAGTWSIGNDDDQVLKYKIESLGSPLKNWNIKIYRGILTGLNKAFLIDQEIKKELEKADPRSSAIIKPVLRGKDIGTFRNKFSHLYLLMTGFDTNIKDCYPAVYAHLEKFEQKARQRDDQGKNWFNLRSCGYYHEFEKEKIVFQEIVRAPQFFLDKSGTYFCEASAFIITGENLTYLIGMLNSKPIAYFFKKYYAGGGLGESGFRYKKRFLEELPIPKYDPANKVFIEIEKKVNQIIEMTNTNNDSNTTFIESEIDNLLYQFYNLDENQINQIESSIIK